MPRGWVAHAANDGRDPGMLLSRCGLTTDWHAGRQGAGNTFLGRWSLASKR